MDGILPPDVEHAAKQARSQAIAEYFESGGSADDTSAEGITGQIPLLHLVLSASPRDGVPRGLIGDRLEEAVRRPRAELGRGTFTSPEFAWTGSASYAARAARRHRRIFF